MEQAPRTVGTAVLRDYPLRLWAAQQEHTAELLREFTLVLLGEQSGETGHEAPRQLVDLATSFTRTYGGLIDTISSARQRAWDAGQDRMDSEVPMPEGLPGLLEQVARVLDAVDAYCRSGGMLSLARPPESVALFDWTCRELLHQYDGGAAEPWPGPF